MGDVKGSMDHMEPWDWERCHAVGLLILSFEHVMFAIIAAYITWLLLNRQTQDQGSTVPQTQNCSCTYRAIDSTQEIPLCLR